MTREVRRKLTIDAMTSSGRDERIAWAVHALDLGAAPSPNLCSLALFSVGRMPNPWKVDDLFRRSVDELGFARPAPDEYLRQHARDIAEGIVAGTVEPLEGARFLFGNHRAWTFDPIAFQHWVEERVIEDGEVRLDLLLGLAKSVVTDASPTIWDALDWVRFDTELLGMDPGLTDCTA